MDGFWDREFTPAPFMEEAACKNADPDVFFVNKGDTGIAAKKLCESCPVKQACLDFAIETHERFGIWGGMNFAERTREAQRRRKAI